MGGAPAAWEFMPDCGRGGTRLLNRRIKIAALLLALAFLLGGCSGGAPETEQAETPPPSQTPEAAQDLPPTPPPTPAQVVDISAYQYQTISNSTLHVSFQYPSHWLSSPGKQTICYVEPVNEGTTAARLAVSSIEVEKAPGDKEMQAQMNRFTDLLGTAYAGFALGETREDVEVMDAKGLRKKYTAMTESGEELTGYILMAYNKTYKRVYLLHFTAPSGKYILLSAVIDAARLSMAAVA